jgi:DNA-nicking Smr family endonuclease
MGHPPPADGDEERSLFDDAMRDVRRIDRDDAERHVIEHAPAVTSPPRLTDETGPDFQIETAGEQVSVFDPSLPPSLRKALRRGTLRPERTLDLHGARSAEAARRVEAFVADALHSGTRCVGVITGRGLRSGDAGPVLRDRVVQLLTRTPLAGHVLALVSAPPSLGGTGALLVLLRRTRP